MKKQLFYCLFFFSPISLTAQVPYTPFDFESAVWSEFYYSLWFFVSEYDVSVQGDTMINDKSYYKLHRDGMSYSYEDIDQIEVIDSSVIDHYFGAVRENDNKQVFWIYPGTEEEIMIYDFNFTSGDTIGIYDLSYFGYEPAVVNYVDSIEICGTFRNRYELRYLDYSIGALLIEGVGHWDGFIPRLELFESGSDLRCFSNEFCDCYDEIITSTENIENSLNSISVFPNPVRTNYLNIETNENLSFNIEVFDMMGRLVYSIQEQTGTITLDCSKWTSGCYYLKIKQAQNQMVQKVIIQ